MSNKLTQIPQNDLIELRDLYLKDWPNNCVGYYTLDNFIRWLDKGFNSKALSVLTLDNDWSDGLFLIIDGDLLFLNALNPSDVRLRIALSLLDWSKGYTCSSFLELHRSAVLSTVESNKLEKEFDNLTLLYYLPRDVAIRMEIRCPEDMIVMDMDEEHAIVANNVWPHKHEGSLLFLERLIKFNPNVGLFTKDNNELIAWCFRLPGGFLGALQVKDTHKRRGLGGVVLRAMCKKLGEMGHDVTACVLEENFPSRKLFEKHNFTIINKIFWLRTFPTKDFI